jgi:hypothetical protein
VNVVTDERVAMLVVLQQQRRQVGFARQALLLAVEGWMP